MACRSLLDRILQAATDNRLIPFNPVAKVRPPKRPVDPEGIFGRIRPRTDSPEEFGQFLAACPGFHRDHFITQVATGLRSGELLGLRQGCVDGTTSSEVCGLGCRPGTTAGPTRRRWRPLASPTSTFETARPAPHLRDLAGGRGHPQPGDR